MMLRITMLLLLVVCSLSLQAQRPAQAYPMFLVAKVQGADMEFAFSAKATTYQQREEYEVWSWRWEFGDGRISEEASPVHRYSEPGAYKVCVQAEGPEGIARHCRLLEVEATTYQAHIGAQVAYHSRNHTVYAVFDQEIGMGSMTIEHPEGTVWWEGPLDGGSFELNLDGAAPGLYIYRLKQPRMEADRFELWIKE